MEITWEEILGIAKNMPGIVVVYKADKQYKRIYYSDGFPELFGYTPEEFKQFKDADVFARLLEADRQLIGARITACLQENRDVDFTYRVEHKSKGYIWVHAKAHVIGTMDGVPVFLTVMFDVSQETKSRELVLDNTMRSIYVCDAKTRELLYVNAKLYEYAGLTEKDILGKKCYEALCHKNEEERANCPGLQALRSGKALRGWDEKSGTYYEVLAKPIVWGNREAFVVYQADISEEIETLNVYRKHIDSLMKMNPDAVSAFPFNLNKNLCYNSVAAISGLEQLSASGKADETVFSSLPHIVNEEERREFAQKLDLNNLLKSYAEGVYKQVIRYTYMAPDNQQRKLCTTAELFKNPITGDIEGVAYTVDETKEYVDSRIQKVLLEKEYDLIVLMDLEGNTYRVHTNAFGHAHKEVGKVVDSDSFTPEDMEKLHILPKDMPEFLRRCSPERIRKELAHKESYSFTMNGVSYMYPDKIRTRKYTFYYMDEEKRYVICTIEDVTDIMHVDTVTGAYNRSGFLDRVEAIVKYSKEAEEYALLFFNIKGFKVINALFGVESGDNVLRTTIELLKSSKLKPLAVSRFEADHFVALIRRKNLDFEAVEAMGDRSYGLFNGKPFRFYARCGIYLITDKNEAVPLMCDKAKLAKEYIVDDYVKPYSIYDDSMKEEFLEKKELLSDLSHALKNQEFLVYYQPVYDLKTEKLASAEALVRWNHPTRGIIGPGKFIPTFEENGYISELDMFVVKSTGAFLLKREAEGKRNVPIAVNLSRMDFYDEKMMEEIVEVLKASDLPPGIPRVEITESAYSVLAGQRHSRLDELKSLGVSILLDDFGSGYSSFSTLETLDFDIIKLDMGFVQKIGINSKVEYIIETIIEMAHKMGSKVIAEGAETKAQVDFLKAMDCDYVQGYYYAKPLPKEVFGDLLDQEEA